MNLISQLQQKISSVVTGDTQPIVVAYSGGVDSHVLLHAVNCLRIQQKLANPLSAIHIHHGLSGNADHWLAHCQQVCAALDLPLAYAKVAVTKVKRHSLEAQARDARYLAIAELAPANALILLAQHADDQLETLLLQLKRGAGPKGLAGMAELSRPESEPAKSKTLCFYRPFLQISQRSIVDYAEQHDLAWVEDESNQNIDFERNFLRHQVLPILNQKWPDFKKTAARSAQLCAEQQHLLDEISAQKLAEVQADDTSLHIQPLLEMSSPWLNQVVRHWLQQSNIPMPSQAVLQRLKPELLLSKIDANPIIQWADWQFRRFDQRLFVIRSMPSIEPQTICWQLHTVLTLPQYLGTLERLPFDPQAQSQNLCLSNNTDELQLQFGGFTQRFKPYNSNYSKPLKQWFKEWKIAPWQRSKIVLLVDQDVPLALLCNGRWIVSHQHQMYLNSAQASQLTAIRYRA